MTPTALWRVIINIIIIITWYHGASSAEVV